MMTLNLTLDSTDKTTFHLAKFNDCKWLVFELGDNDLSRINFDVLNGTKVELLDRLIADLEKCKAQLEEDK